MSESSPSSRSTSAFRRGHSKVFYESHWEGGGGHGPNARLAKMASTDDDDLEARTSFRSNRSSSKASLALASDSSDEDVVTSATAETAEAVAAPFRAANGSMNRSAELDDILEEESEEDSTHSSPVPPSSEEHQSSSSSPDCSFRLGPSARPLARRSRDSSNSTDSEKELSRVKSPHPPPPPTTAVRGGLAPSLSHKSHDSGFSDSAESNHGGDSSSSSSTASSASPTGVPRSKEVAGDTSRKEDEAGVSPQVHSEVVHETRTSSFDRRQYHVSKVYFYSISDIISQEKEDAKKQHQSLPPPSQSNLSVSSEERPTSPVGVLSPPLSPPLARSQPKQSDGDVGVPAATPSCFASLNLEYKPIPILKKTKSNNVLSGNATTSTQTQQQRIEESLKTAKRPVASPRIHAGTSSLGRSSKIRPGSASSSSSGPHFPKTNGSLYESLSLGRTTPAESNRSDRRAINLNSVHTLRRRFSDSPATPAVTPSSAASSPNDVSQDSGSVSIPSLASDDNGVTSRDPVNFWLRELALVHESECTIMLQSKPIAEDSNNSNSNRRPLGNRGGLFLLCGGSSRETITRIQSKAHAISAVFAKLCRQLGHKSGGNVTPSSASPSRLVPLVQGLSHQVHLFLVEYNSSNRLPKLPGFRPRTGKRENSDPGSQEVPEEILHQQRVLRGCCDRLKLTASRFQPGSAASVEEAVDTVTQLGAAFTRMIELMLSREIKASVDRLNRSRDQELKASIDAIIGLALEGNHLCRLIAKHGGVRSLLTVCVDPKLRRCRVGAFRALGTVCCVLEAIMELEESGGVQILSDTLRDKDVQEVEEEGGATEEEKSEAAGLLAQITSPWIENNTGIEGLKRHLSQLVESLTLLSRRTASAETFLLSSAALANLSFMEPEVTGMMCRHGTVKVLVNAVRQQKAISIYIQDQVAAVLANMAANESCRQEVIRHGGLPVLLRFLQAQPPSRPSKQEDFAQMSATERVLQKSAIALSRLCSDRHLSEQVLRLGGLTRLVRLCKDESARVGSDGVLLACLAAVRRIAGACCNQDGDASAKQQLRSILEELDAGELVEPRLLDSFLIFSSKNESFV